jgi:predicted ATP-dependent protease
MNLENVIYKLQRNLDKRIQQLAISVTSGGVDSMETYKYIIGQINALEAAKQEISNLLNEKEQNEGTVVDIKTKNTLTE